MEKKDRKPGAFMCYARINDRDGTLTKLREKLSMEVEEQIGEEFPIFQDIEDIKWGEDWKERIDESLSEVTFFIPIITPSFFKSKYCRDELNQFLDREKTLGRNDLVLPIYYIETPLLETEAEREIADEDSDSEREIKILAKTISDRQRPSCADWRKLRAKCRNSFEAVEIYEALEGLAIQFRDALDRLAPMRKEPSVRVNTKPKNVQPPKTQLIKKHPRPKASRAEIIVDQAHNGDYATISEAIRAARPGDKIIVHPGLYQEGLVIDKPLEITGEGERNEIVIHAFGKNALLFKTTSGRVANLTLRQMGEGDWFGVDIAQGSLILENCDISSQSLACVAIHDGADPHLLSNVIHDGKQSGVYVYETGQGILKENDIFGNTYSGVMIRTGGNPALHDNNIHDGKKSGVLINENGKGILEKNKIYSNAFSGVEIKSNGNPTLCHNKIYDGKQNGVLVWENGRGIIEKNEIFENAYSGVMIMTGGNPTLHHNWINRNGIFGFAIVNNGGGVIENNDLRSNKDGARYISEDSEPNVKHSGNIE